ncbi:MAG: Hsp70 family protein, partial [Egibacteraceae bacterium]
MSYQLGIDVGTTYTAAAVCRDGRAEIVTLGTRAACVPSVLYIRADGEVMIGEAANRRAVAEADRVVREFKRRIGDPTPLVVGGVAYRAEALVGRLLRWVVDVVTQREGAAPAHIALTHPASWGPYKQDVLAQAARLAELGPVTMLTEPEAAAISYARTERVEAGATIAVYDLGGGTFDAAVVRKAGSGGFGLLGTPEGIDRLGGVDFDEIVFAHVARACNGALDKLDPADPVALAAVARLRQECTDAKEALSTDTDVSIPVLLPNLRTQVRLVRAELEAMIRPALGETTAALYRAMRSAKLDRADLSAVLLVGGSSRIPLVSQMVSEAVGRPVVVDADPKNAIALGAALAATPRPIPAPSPAFVTVPPPPPSAPIPPRPPAHQSELSPGLAVPVPPRLSAVSVSSGPPAHQPESSPGLAVPV